MQLSSLHSQYQIIIQNEDEGPVAQQEFLPVIKILCPENNHHCSPGTGEMLI